MISHRISKWSVTDATSRAYKDGVLHGKMELLLPYDVESVEELIENVRNKAMKDALKYAAKIVDDYACDKTTAEKALWNITKYISEQIKEKTE